MTKQKKSQEIIERIEYIRNYLRLNKSRFSGEIGLKPQTYNNFIGAQGSKPSVELILGTVNRFGADPNWILNGKGPVFQDWGTEKGQRLRPSVDMGTWASQLSEPGTTDAMVDQQRADILQQVSSLIERVKESERRLDSMEGSRFPAVGEMGKMMMRLYEIDPVKAENKAESILADLREAVGD